LIVKSNVMNKNQLHSQLSYSYPSYRKFFAMIDSKSALCSGRTTVTGVYMEHNTGRNISDNKAGASGT